MTFNNNTVKSGDYVLKGTVHMASGSDAEFVNCNWFNNYAVRAVESPAALPHAMHAHDPPSCF